MNDIEQDGALIAAARAAAEHSYSPYSKFAVGAALRFADGSVVTGANIENASYGMTLCAETVAVAKAMADGVRRAGSGCGDGSGGRRNHAVRAVPASLVRTCGFGRHRSRHIVRWS